MTAAPLPGLTRRAIALNLLGSLLVLLGTGILTVSLNQILDREDADVLLERAGVAAIGFAAFALIGLGCAVGLFFSTFRRSMKDAWANVRMIIGVFAPPTSVAFSVTTSLLLTAGLISTQLPPAGISLLGAIFTLGGWWASYGFWSRAWRSIQRAWSNNLSSTNSTPTSSSTSGP